MLRGGDLKEIYEMHGRGHSARAIAWGLGLARNTVLRYLNSPEAMLPKPRPPRGSQLDPYTEHIYRRLAEGLENCVVLLRELRARGYQGSYTILVEYVRPRRRGVSLRRRCGLRRRRENKLRWTGAVCRTSARTGSYAASGCS